MWRRILLTIVFCVGGCLGNQTALVDTLFANYRSQVRPICGSDVPIEVKVGMAMRQVIDLDEPKQILSANVWIRLRWYDCQLTWNASDYGGISSLILPYSKVWTPDITLYDNAGDEIAGMKDYRPAVSSDGSVSYNFPTVINSLCLVDVTAFPFDIQRCPIPFGSWAFHGLQLNVTSLASDADMSNFQVNSEWDLVKVPAKRHVLMYSCCLEPYPDVTFYVTLRRKPLFYVLNLLFPCILISMIALLGFLLPPDSGEKVGLELTVLLSLAVFMLVVAETLPPTSESFPLIGVYFCLAMMMVTFSTVLSVVVVNIHYRGQLGYSVPKWLRKMFLGRMARFLCVQHEGCVYPVQIVVSGNAKQVRFDDKVYSDGVIQTNNNALREFQEKKAEFQQQSSPLTGVLNEQLAILKRFDSHCAEKDQTENMENEWKTVAVVMDRLFLLIFSILLIGCTVGILIECVTQAV